MDERQRIIKFAENLERELDAAFLAEFEVEILHFRPYLFDGICEIVKREANRRATRQPKLSAHPRAE